MDYGYNSYYIYSQGINSQTEYVDEICDTTLDFEALFYIGQLIKSSQNDTYQEDRTIIGIEKRN